jgi:phosphoribosylamine---glycine ligase
LKKRGLRIFGASQKAAAIEGSKSFAKQIMNKYGVPTAGSATLRDFKKALAYVRKTGAPMVVKADGLAAGKGVIVCRSVAEARSGAGAILVDNANSARPGQRGGGRVPQGEEASFLAFTDGRTVLPLPTSQDHKAIFRRRPRTQHGRHGRLLAGAGRGPADPRKVMNEVMLPTVRPWRPKGGPTKACFTPG